MALYFSSCITLSFFYLLSAALALAFLYAAVLIVYFLMCCCKKLIRREPDRPPVAGTILQLFFHFDSLYDYQTDIARNHPTFRLSKPGYSAIFTADPANVEHILKTNFHCYTKGKYNYDIMSDLLGEGIFVVDGEKWKQQRKLASYQFSTRNIRDYSSRIFRENAAKLANKISGAASFIDMQDLLMKTTLDSIFRVGFGVDLGTLSGSDAAGARFSKAFDNANRITFGRYVDLFWKLKRILNLGMEAELKKNIKIIDDFVFSLIQRKREMMKNGTGDRNKDDILSRFILAGEKEPGNMSDKDLRDIILNFLIAGKDTSANTLSWFFYMMCKHPDVQEKVTMEINESMVCAAGGDTGIHEFASGINDEVLDRMHYLHAVMTETLRLYPAVPTDAKYATEDDVLPDGFKIKKGDGITYMGYAMGRMKYIWGDNAEEFRPERWLNNGSFFPESSFKFVSFNAGPRLCLGKEFAYRQMKIVAAVLLHFFQFKLVDDSKNVTYKTMFTLHIDKGLHLYAIRRIISGI